MFHQNGKTTTNYFVHSSLVVITSKSRTQPTMPRQVVPHHVLHDEAAHRRQELGEEDDVEQLGGHIVRLHDLLQNKSRFPYFERKI